MTKTNQKPATEKDSIVEIVEETQKNLMPVNDPLYKGYLDKLSKFAPTATFMTQFPYGCPTTFNGGVFSFLVSIPSVVGSHKRNGVIVPTTINRLLLASIIEPPQYEEINKYPRPEEIEHLEFWKREVQTKNPNYYALQQFCKNKNIIMFETLYIDFIRDKIAELHAYEEF